jgi:hypothetical protein
MANMQVAVYRSERTSESGSAARMYFLHPDPKPDACDVCAYVRDHKEADQMLEHTMVRIAVGFMLEDLMAEGRPMRMRQLYRAGVGWPGRDYRFEGRHWFWALMVMDDFRISLVEGRGIEQFRREESS